MKPDIDEPQRDWSGRAYNEWFVWGTGANPTKREFVVRFGCYEAWADAATGELRRIAWLSDGMWQTLPPDTFQHVSPPVLHGGRDMQNFVRNYLTLTQ